MVLEIAIEEGPDRHLSRLKPNSRHGSDRRQRIAISPDVNVDPNGIVRFDLSGQQSAHKWPRGKRQVIQIKRFVYAQIHRQYQPQLCPL